jgi:hypothetical protein
MTNILLNFNRLYLILGFAIGLLLIRYQISAIDENGFFYLLDSEICLYYLNRFLLQISYIRIAPTLLVPFLFSRS